MRLNHPETNPTPWSVEKLSSTKLVPGAKKVGDRCYKEHSKGIQNRVFKGLYLDNEARLLHWRGEKTLAVAQYTIIDNSVSAWYKY